MNTEIQTENHLVDATVPENKTKKILTVILFSIISIVMLLPLASHAENKLAGLFSSPKSKFLKVNEAFQTITTQKGNKLKVDIVVTPKHYVYKNRIHLTLANGKKIQPVTFNLKPDVVNDPEFGRVPVFQKNVSLTAILPKSVKSGEKLTLKWQGCAKAGLCYPPVTEKVTLKSVTSVKKKQR